MSDSGNSDYMVCPLCEGKGKMRRSQMAAKLADHEVEAKLTFCRQQLVKPEASRQSTATEVSDFKEEVLKGPVTRILWRRSPKE